MTWNPADRVQWNPVGSDYPHPTVGTALGFGETSGQRWTDGYASPPEPYYVVELDPPVTLRAFPAMSIDAHTVTELRVLGSALERAL